MMLSGNGGGGDPLPNSIEKALEKCEIYLLKCIGGFKNQKLIKVHLLLYLSGGC